MDRVRPRRIAFNFTDDIPKHWVGGSATRTHLMNSLNLFLPAFERMIIRNIKQHVLPRIGDEHLREQAQGLVAQEALHSKAHGLFLRNLRAQGYRIDGYLRVSEWLFERVMIGRLPPALVLASVASFEHYTDLLVELLAESDFLDGCEPRMRELLSWHAAEEVEHHAVPFLLLRELGGGYLLRQAGNVLGLGIIFTFMMAGALMLLWQDRALFTMRAMRELGRFFFGRYGVVRNTLRLFGRYLRRGYRPDEVDRAAFAQRILERAA